MSPQKDPKYSKNLLNAFVIGFAVFSMVFGAGNLIFPPFIGLESGRKWLLGLIPFFLADVGIFLLCLKAFMRKRGPVEDFFAPLGKWPARILCLLTALAMGPLIVIPRTGSTSYELSAKPLIPGMSPWIFTFLFFAIVALLTARPSKVVDIIGKYLTPVLLLTLAVVVIKGIITPFGPMTEMDPEYRLVGSGLVAGYQALDGMSAMLLFMVLLQTIMDKGYRDEKEQNRILNRSSLVAVVGLLLVYAGLCYLGATVSSASLEDLSRTELLIYITEGLLGRFGTVLMAVIVLFACLTTAIGITSAVAGYLTDMLKRRISYALMVVILCFVSFMLSNLGTETILNLAGPLVSLLYPILLTQVILSFFRERIRNKNVFRGAALGALLMGLPIFVQDMGLLEMAWLDKLPLMDEGLTWIIPAVLGAVIGALVKERS